MESNEPPKQSKNERIEAFLREQYEFRFNTVKSRTEFRVGGNGAFLPVTKFCLNSIRRELDRTTGINTSADNIRAILESDFSEKRMGEALRKAGFVRISKRVNPKSSVYGWLVRKVTPNPFNSYP